jgi:hypothetical protein
MPAQRYISLRLGRKNKSAKKCQQQPEGPFDNESEGRAFEYSHRGRTNSSLPARADVDVNRENG